MQTGCLCLFLSFNLPIIIFCLFHTGEALIIVTQCAHRKRTDNIHRTKLENIHVSIWLTEIAIPLAVSFLLVKIGVNLLLTCACTQPKFPNSLSIIFYSGIISSTTTEYYKICVKISLLAVSHLPCWHALVIIIDISIYRKTGLISLCVSSHYLKNSACISCICFSSKIDLELSLCQFSIKS